MFFISYTMEVTTGDWMSSSVCRLETGVFIAADGLHGREFGGYEVRERYEV